MKHLFNKYSGFIKTSGGALVLPNDDKEDMRELKKAFQTMNIRPDKVHKPSGYSLRKSFKPIEFKLV